MYGEWEARCSKKESRRDLVCACGWGLPVDCNVHGDREAECSKRTLVGACVCGLPVEGCVHGDGEAGCARGTLISGCVCGWGPSGLLLLLLLLLGGRVCVCVCQERGSFNTVERELRAQSVQLLWLLRT